MATLSPPRPPTPSALRPEAPRTVSRPQRRWERPGGRAAAGDDVATLCLLLVTIAVGLGMARLFTDKTYIPYVVGAAVLAHGVAWALRRLDAGLTVASFVAGVGSPIFAVWLVLPGDTALGLITPHTLDVLGAELTTARQVFREAVTPVVPLPGFLIAACFGVGLVAFLSDWAAFRMRASFEAVVPAFALFVATAVWGTPAYRSQSIAALAVAALAFLIVQRAALDAERGAWFNGSGAGSLPSLLASGAAIGGVALVAGLVLGPHLPGASAKPIYSPLGDRGGQRGNRSRSTISPLVDIRPRVIDPSDAPVFQVQSARPAYWRLTSLDAYDGQIWSSNERYRSVDERLSTALYAGDVVEQRFAVSSLASIWLPAAYQPTRVNGIEDVSWSARSGSLISQQETSDGLEYTVTSTLYDPSPGVLRATTAGTAGGLGEQLGMFTAQPRVSPPVLRLARELTAGRTTAYDKAFAIQQRLRTWTYDLNIQFGHGTDAITTFITQKRGYCQQFAATFAVLARLAGLPARVAVGFRVGRETSAGTFDVRNKDAHAWPEVFFDGVGWVAFEPTPDAPGLSNGNPQGAAAQSTFTPAPASGAAGADGQAPGATPTTAPAAAAPTTTIPEDEAAASAPQDVTTQDGTPTWLLVAFGLLVGTLLLAGLVVGGLWQVAEGRRRSRRTAARSPQDRVGLAWTEAEEALGLLRLTRRSTSTIDEWLGRLDRPAGGVVWPGLARGTAAHDALRRLGAALVGAAYGPAVSEDAAARAAADSDVVVRAAHDACGTARLWRWRLDPTPAWRDRRKQRAIRSARLSAVAVGPDRPR